MFKVPQLLPERNTGRISRIDTLPSTCVLRMIRNHPSPSTPAREQCLLTNIFFGIPEFASTGLCCTVEREATVSRRFRNSRKPPDLHVLHHQRHAMYIWQWVSHRMSKTRRTTTTPNRRKSGNVVVLDARYMQICYFLEPILKAT